MGQLEKEIHYTKYEIDPTHSLKQWTLKGNEKTLWQIAIIYGDILEISRY